MFSCSVVSDSWRATNKNRRVFIQAKLRRIALRSCSREVWFLAILCLIRKKYIKQVRDTCLQGSEEAHQHVHRESVQLWPWEKSLIIKGVSASASQAGGIYLYLLNFWSVCPFPFSLMTKADHRVCLTGCCRQPTSKLNGM